MLDRALRILSRRKAALPAEPGVVTVLDGAGAVEAVEGPLLGSLAEALGAAAAGARAAAGLRPAEVPLLAEAVRRHLPLVAHGSTPPEGTDAFVLVPSTVQEAADLALVARRTAEAALVPGFLAVDFPGVLQDLHLPSRTFLGEPGDRIPTPTPAQRMLFGEERRRVPRRFDPARPVLTGPGGGPLEQAAHEYAFAEPVTGLLEEAAASLAERTGRRQGLVQAEGDLDAELVVVAMGSVLGPLRAVAAHLRSSGLLKVGVVGVRCLHPFPTLRVMALLKGHRKVAVIGEPLQRALPGHLAVHAHGAVRDADLVALLTRLAGSTCGPLHLGVDLVPVDRRSPDQEVLRGQVLRAWPGLEDRGVRSWRDARDFRPPGAVTVVVQRRSGGPGEGLAGQIVRALHETLGGSVQARTATSPEAYGAPLRDRVTWAPEPLLTDDGPTEVLVLADPSAQAAEAGVVLVLPGVAAPATKARVLAVPEARLLDAVVALVRRQEPPGAEPAAPGHPVRPREEVPLRARLPGASRFHRQEALPALRGEPLAADPWKALGEVPPLAATFRDLAPLRATLPVFDPSACTGCAACWPACPEGALAPLAFTPQALLDAGISRVPDAMPLRRVAGKLAARMARDLSGPEPPRTAGDLLCRAYEAVAPGLPADRREEADRALTALADVLRVLPLAVTEPFFWEGGRTLSVVLDPDPCKACGACATACEAGALTLRPQEPGPLEHARRLHHLWQELPDATDPLPGLAGLYMDRERLLSMAGADGAEPGSGAKLALRAVLAVLAKAWSPPDVQGLRERLDGALRALMAEGLEVDGEGSLDPTGLDRERLSQLVGFGRALQDLEASGPGLALTGEVPWPGNPFALPVFAGASAAAALGLAEALSRQSPADLLRRSHAILGEEAPPFAPAPLLLVGPEADLAADPALLRLLAGTLPVKVVALADPGTPGPDTALLAMALRNPCVLQSTPACPDHLVAGLEEAFRTPGPALLRLHAPSPSRDGFPADRTLQRSREAVEARVFPLWRYSPAGGLDLGGNPPEAGTPQEWSAGEARRPAVSRATWEGLQPPAAPAAPEPPPAVDLEEVRAALEEEITERVRLRLLALAGFPP